jgi:adenine-specific DNA-methyltransferase
MATISNDKFVTKKDVYTFKLNQNKFSLKYLLAIINSKLISFTKTKGSASAKKDDFTQLTLNDIRQLRIPEPSTIQVKRIEDNVDKILSLKAQGQDTSELEAKIDAMVYELYGLTEEEIRIVEDGK